MVRGIVCTMSRFPSHVKAPKYLLSTSARRFDGPFKESYRRLEFELRAWFVGPHGFRMVVSIWQLKEHGLGTFSRADLHPRGQASGSSRRGITHAQAARMNRSRKATGMGRVQFRAEPPDGLWRLLENAVALRHDPYRGRGSQGGVRTWRSIRRLRPFAIELWQLGQSSICKPTESLTPDKCAITGVTY